MVVGLRYFSAVALLGMAPWWSMNNALRSISRGKLALRFSSKSGGQFNHPSKSVKAWARKAANGEDKPKIPAGWTTIKYGTEEDTKNAEMDDRIREAERWVSKKLSDKDAQDLNRVMGIEAEVLAALAAEEDEQSGQKKRGVNPKGKAAANDKSAAKTKLQDYLAVETRDAAKVKGFLELNPYVCSGCGTPFQSKSTDTPGYLSKEKIKVHLVKAQKIRDKQEAIKILELAGIQVDSEAAEEILRGANVSDDVIAGVRALTRGQSVIDQRELEMKKKMAGRSGRSAYEIARDKAESGENDEDDDDDEYLDEEDDSESLDIDLEDLMSSAEKSPDGSVIAALKGTIAAGLDNKESEFDTPSTAARELSSSTKMYFNDIDAELGGKKSSFSFENTVVQPVETNRRNSKRLQMERDAKYNAMIFEKKKFEDTTGERAFGLLVEKEGEREAAMTVSDFEKSIEDDSICICQRCFKLQQYGSVEESLRPGWSDHELLTPERFETLLECIRETETVVLCIVDVFDLKGSLLPNLKQIAGTNPIVIAANKVDLLPKDVSSARLTSWIHTEVKEFCDLRSPREAEDMKRQEMVAKGWYRPEKGEDEGLLRRSNVHLVSCQSGAGMTDLMKSLMGLAADNGNKVYVMGAANVGKSSFINRLLESDYKKGVAGAHNKQNRGRNSKDQSPQATVSNLPGTTLNFLKIKLPNGVTMIDTPGLINRGQLTSRLNTEELKQVIPNKPINAVTLRVSEGKCVLIGGLAIVEHQEGKPFFFTFFISNEVKLHPTDALRAQEFISRHVGGLLTPPMTQERYEKLGPFKDSFFEVEGDEWRKASTDVVIAGLGWISITGPGICKIKITAPEGTSVGLRSPLLPFEASHTTGKFTGGRLLKRSKKGGEKAYGWRA